MVGLAEDGRMIPHSFPDCLRMHQMEKNRWAAVPQFGGWDHNDPVSNNYSVVFSKARANRKQHKSDIRHASLGNERELLAARKHEDSDESIVKGKKILTYINCCIRPY